MSLTNVNVNISVDGEKLSPITPSHLTVNVGTESTLVLAENPDRKYLLLANGSNTDMYISLDGPAQVGEGIPVNAGGNYEMLAGYITTGAIYAIHDGEGDQKLLVTEGV